MFCDTHCHLSHISERGIDLSSLLADLEAQQTPFIMDIGTKPGDLQARLSKITDIGPIPSFLFFSCGLWPDSQVIARRKESLQLLEKDLTSLLGLNTFKYVALGECGIDRYWNGKDAPGAHAYKKRAQEAASNSIPNAKSSYDDDGPGTLDTQGEEDLFSMQLDLSSTLKLPTIVHSRDGFDATLGCIKNSGWDHGVIHCYSYGVSEARAFLDRGWYISFPGNITYPKKQKDKDTVAELLRFVPKDRLLLETDAPYLAPVPFRGTVNTPALISHVYEKAAEILDMPIEQLAFLVFENAKACFSQVK